MSDIGYQGAPSTASDIASSVKHVFSLDRTKPKQVPNVTPVSEPAEETPAPATPRGHSTEAEQLRDTLAGGGDTNAEATDASNSSNVSSNAGRQAQSSDHMNGH